MAIYLAEYHFAVSAKDEKEAAVIVSRHFGEGKNRSCPLIKNLETGEKDFVCLQTLENSDYCEGRR